MKSTKFDTPPLSGDYEERCFSDKYSTSFLWVKFITDSNKEWVGAFGKGSYGITKILEQGEFVFVIATGKGYLVNRNTKELIYLEEGFPFIKSAIITSNPDLFIYSADYGYKIIKDGIIIKDMRPKWIDGIEFIEQQGRLVNGQIWEISQDDFWNKATLDLNTFELQVDKSILIDYRGTNNENRPNY